MHRIAPEKGANIHNNNNILYANINIYIGQHLGWIGRESAMICHPFLIFKSFRKRSGAQLKFRTDVVGRVLYSILVDMCVKAECKELTHTHTHSKY